MQTNAIHSADREGDAQARAMRESSTAPSRTRSSGLVRGPQPRSARPSARPLWLMLGPLWDLATSGRFAYDHQGRLAYCNPALGRMVGMTPQLGSTQIIPEVVPESRTALTRCFTRLRNSAESRTVDLNVAAFVGDESRLFRLLLVAVDDGTSSTRVLVGEITPMIDTIEDSNHDGPEDRLLALERTLARIKLEVSTVGPSAHNNNVGIEMLDELSPRQQMVLRRLAMGKRPAEIAREFTLSANTVRNHVKSIYRKLGVHSQAELTARFWANDADALT